MTELRQEVGLDPSVVREWVHRLTSGNRHLRYEASRKFRELPVRQRRLIMVSTYRQAFEYQNNAYAYATLFGLMAMAISAALLPGPSAIFLLIVLCSFGLGFWFSIRNSSRNEVIKNLFDQTFDAGLIPYILVRLNYVRNSGYNYRYVLAGRNMRNALVRLLPYVQEADAEDWTGTHWRFLLRYLQNPFEDIELTLAILDVCARVGNADAKRAVEKTLDLLDKTNSSTVMWTPGGVEFLIGKSARAAQQANLQMLKEKAQQTMIPLEARLQQQFLQSTLLRPSDQGSAVSPEVLLRPASAVSAIPSEELLRPQINETSI